MVPLSVRPLLHLYLLYSFIYRFTFSKHWTSSCLLLLSSVAITLCLSSALHAWSDSPLGPPAKRCIVWPLLTPNIQGSFIFPHSGVLTAGQTKKKNLVSWNDDEHLFNPNFMNTKLIIRDALEIFWWTLLSVAALQFPNNGTLLPNLRTNCSICLLFQETSKQTKKKYVPQLFVTFD